MFAGCHEGMLGVGGGGGGGCYTGEESLEGTEQGHLGRI